MFTPFIARNAAPFFGADVDRLFDAFLNPGAQAQFPDLQASRFPALNLWEDQDAYFLEAEIPGLRAEDVEVVVLGNELTIKGERRQPEGKPTAVHRRERASGKFGRVVQLPTEVNADAVEASVASGVLSLRLPKAESARPRRIQIQN